MQVCKIGDSCLTSVRPHQLDQFLADGYVQVTSGREDDKVIDANGNWVFPCGSEEEYKKQCFRNARKVILDGVTWMHERAQSQSALVYAGLLTDTDWTTEEFNEYLMWKQQLCAIPQSGEGWQDNVQWPTVPQHVYDYMWDETKQLCVELGCNPA